MSGTASHCKKITEISDNKIKINRGSICGSFFPLNFHGKHGNTAHHS